MQELLPAKTKSYELGLTLNLQPYEVQSIHNTHTDPQQRLLYILTEFLDQVNPKPTWEVIVNALRNPAVNLHRLAGEIEAAHLTRVNLSPFIDTSGGKN